LAKGAGWTGFPQYTSPGVDKTQTFTRAKTLWDWLQLLIIPVVIALGVFWLNHQEAKRKLAADREDAKRKQEAEERRAATDRKLAAEHAREQALTGYFDTIAKLLLESNLRTSRPESEVREVARCVHPRRGPSTGRAA
jgi:cell division protein FtsL